MLSRRKLLHSGLACLLPYPCWISASPATESEYDIVIIGSGAAGLASAVAAHQQKVSDILILEREPFIGGSSAVCGGQFAVAGTELQRSLGINDSEDLFFEDMMRAGGYQNDPALVRVFVHEVRLQYEWLLSRGLHSQPPAAHSSMSIPRAHQIDPDRVIQTLRLEAVSNGSIIRTGARAIDLQTDSDGRVTGVWFVHNQRRHLARARKSVVIASGGFSRNRPLLQHYAPEMVDVLTVAGIGSQGDGIIMAQKLNAGLADMNNVKASYGFLLNSSTVRDFTWLFYSGAIIVNNKGQRFVDESLSYRTIGDAALKQKYPLTYIVFDDVVRKTQMGKRRIDFNLWSPIDQGEKPEYLFMADSIEDLAVQAGIDASSLKQTVQRYNQFVAKGKDEDFGRTSLSSGFGNLIALKQPPFFLVPALPGIFGTYGGIKISPKAQVLTTNGSVIPGLYAAGEVTGGIHGRGFIGGTGFGKALAFGKVAGSYAAHE